MAIWWSFKLANSNYKGFLISEQIFSELMKTCSANRWRHGQKLKTKLYSAVRSGPKGGKFQIFWKLTNKYTNSLANSVQNIWWRCNNGKRIIMSSFWKEEQNHIKRFQMFKWTLFFGFLNKSKNNRQFKSLIPITYFVQ